MSDIRGNDVIVRFVESITDRALQAKHIFRAIPPSIYV